MAIMRQPEQQVRRPEDQGRYWQQWRAYPTVVVPWRLSLDPPV